jgi:2-amino-4-hydroxy-6-hydroxymethyldihydropteridine diphosphokinase
MSLNRQCLVSFGSNLGTRDSVIVTAIRELAQIPKVENFRASRLFETPPIGGPLGQSPFLNGVAVFDTQSRAREVLDWLQSIEQQLGRQRELRWAARSIDLDVVLHGSLIGGASDLTVPHPRYTARRFVLRPACDIAADYCDPRFGWTIGQLADHLDAGNASLALTGGDESIRQELCRLLTSLHGIRVFQASPLPAPMAVLGTAPLVSREYYNTVSQTMIDVEEDQPWVSAFVPPLPDRFNTLATPDKHAGTETDERAIPRLIARIQWTKPEERWPAPHRIYPSSLQWPEYRLEIDDYTWAAGEIASALASMRCPLTPISDNGDWWR